MEGSNMRTDTNLSTRFFVVNLVGGSVVGVGLAATLLLLDLGHLRTLIMTSDSEALALVMMIVGLALTYGTAATAGAIMLLSSHDEGVGGTRQKLVLSRVAARKNRSARRADGDPDF
jgi:hypothetical protein